MKNLSVGMFGTEKLSSFQLGLHHFNPPPKESSYKRDNEVLHEIGKILGDEHCV
jgi:predicted Zn-dependent protease